MRPPDWFCICVNESCAQTAHARRQRTQQGAQQQTQRTASIACFSAAVITWSFGKMFTLRRRRNRGQRLAARKSRQIHATHRAGSTAAASPSGGASGAVCTSVSLRGTVRRVSRCVRAAAHEESKAASAQGAALASSPHALFPSEASSPARRLGPRAAAPGWGTSSAPLSSAPRACARTEPRVSAHSRSRLHSPERRRTAAQARAPATHPQPPPCPPAASNCARSGVLASNSKERYH